MSRPGLSGGQYQPLTPGQIQEIHLTSLRLLEEVGVEVHHAEVREVYRSAGARFGGRGRVFITRKMVAAALESAPSRVLLAGRDPDHDLVLEGKRVYAGTGGSPTEVLDPGAEAVRAATLADLADLVRLADALDRCDFVVIPLYPTDLPEAEVPAHRFYTSLCHTTKHVMGGVGSVEGARQVIEMAALIAGGIEALRARPFVSAITSWMVSPLQLDTAVTDILLAWCREGLPVALSAAPMAGSTSPVTLAGTLVQLNAEQLSGIVLTQLVRPGTPVLAGYIPGLADMRSGGYLGGGVEYGMMQAAAAQMAHYYQVPIYCSGGMSDSKLPDAQAGYEKMATFLLAAMGGCHYIHHAFGMLTNMSVSSLEQAVIDDEIVGMAMRVLRGIEVQEAALALEAIARVGPGGHYLMDEHTLRFMRSEFLQPLVGDRRNRAMWEQAGGHDTRQRARDRVEALLGGHRPVGLAPEVAAAIEGRFGVSLPLCRGWGVPAAIGRALAPRQDYQVT